MTIRKELIDELIATSGGNLIGPDGLVKELTKALVERMLSGEMNHHLGYEKHDVAGHGTGNSRNGKSQKTLKGEAGEMTIAVPRDRNGTFEPRLIEKHQTRFEGFDAKILSMYALGMTVRDIQSHLHEMYGVDVSAGLISEVTDSIQEEVKAWQDRPLEALYPIVYLDALMVKMRQEGKVDNRAVYTAIGINVEGEKSVLGLWVSGNEGAKYWLSVLTNLKNRGMKDAFIICTDGLKGFPEAIEAIFPSTLVQTCIVHLIRASLTGPLYGGLSAELRELEGAQSHGRRSETDLSGRHGGDGGDGAGSVSRQIPQTPGSGGCLGTELAAGDPILRIPRGNPQNHLYDQRGRIAAHDAAKGDEEPGIVPDPGCCYQAAVPRAAERIQEMAFRAGLARSAPPIHHPLAREDRAGSRGLKSQNLSMNMEIAFTQSS
jgi:putative transposase